MLKPLIVLTGTGLLGLSLDSGSAVPAGLPPLTGFQPMPFPESLRLTSVADGYALVMFTVGRDGAVDDAVAIEASHPAFVGVVQEGLASWRFEAMDSKTTPRRELIQFDFRRTGQVASVSHRDAAKGFFPSSAQTTPAIRTVEWDQLSQPPQRTVSVMPVYPQGLGGSPRGFAVVNYIIDSTGAVRVPAVIEASDARFGEEVLKAVRQWRFAAPMHEGQPVNVRMTRSFNFGARSSPK